MIVLIILVSLAEVLLFVFAYTVGKVVGFNEHAKTVQPLHDAYEERAKAYDEQFEAWQTHADTQNKLIATLGEQVEFYKSHAKELV